MPQASAAYVPQVKYMIQHQADAYLNQAAPVQNTWYEVLAATEDVRIISIGGVILVAGETVEGEVTVDGQTIAINAAAFGAGNGREACNRYPSQTYLFWGDEGDNPASRSFLLEGQSVRVRIRKTTAAGAGNLQCRVKWARLLQT